MSEEILPSHPHTGAYNRKTSTNNLNSRYNNPNLTKVQNPLKSKIATSSLYNQMKTMKQFNRKVNKQNSTNRDEVIGAKYLENSNTINTVNTRYQKNQQNYQHDKNNKNKYLICSQEQQAQVSEPNLDHNNIYQVASSSSRQTKSKFNSNTQNQISIANSHKQKQQFQRGIEKIGIQVQKFTDKIQNKTIKINNTPKTSNTVLPKTTKYHFLDDLNTSSQDEAQLFKFNSKNYQHSALKDKLNDSSNQIYNLVENIIHKRSGVSRNRQISEKARDKIVQRKNDSKLILNTEDQFIKRKQQQIQRLKLEQQRKKNQKRKNLALFRSQSVVIINPNQTSICQNLNQVNTVYNLNLQAQKCQQPTRESKKIPNLFKNQPQSQQIYKTSSLNLNKNFNHQKSNYNIIDNNNQKLDIIENNEPTSEINNIMKKRKKNRIFDNSKKYGLKLSRVIARQEQVHKLQRQMGLDTFHIIFQQEELIRNCCS